MEDLDGIEGEYRKATPPKQEGEEGEKSKVEPEVRSLLGEIAKARHPILLRGLL